MSVRKQVGTGNSKKGRIKFNISSHTPSIYNSSSWRFRLAHLPRRQKKLINYIICVCVCTFPSPSPLVVLICLCAQSCPTLCDPMDCSPPGSSLHGISQARILECDTISFSRDLPDSGIEPTSSVFPALGGGFFTTPPGKPPLVLITPALIGDLVNVFYTLLTLVQIFVTYLCLG